MRSKIDLVDMVNPPLPGLEADVTAMREAQAQRKLEKEQERRTRRLERDRRYRPRKRHHPGGVDDGPPFRRLNR